MSTNASIKKYEKKVVASMVKEYNKMDKGEMGGNPVVTPIYPEKLSYEDKRMALEKVNITKDKRKGKIKGRKCADGSKKKCNLKEGESISLPTVSLEALLCTRIVDAHKGSDMEIFGVPGAYLHADIQSTRGR